MTIPYKEEGMECGADFYYSKDGKFSFVEILFFLHTIQITYWIL